MNGAFEYFNSIITPILYVPNVISLDVIVCKSPKNTMGSTKMCFKLSKVAPSTI
jgi:hypothetical protein